MNLSDKMIERLKSLASDMVWNADVYCNSTIDDAFCGGQESGQIQLARQILDDLGIEY